MRQMNSTVEEIRIRRMERERNVREATDLQHEQRAREAAIVAGANKQRAREPRPNLIFAGRQIPLPPPRLVDEDDEGRIEEVSRDSSLDRTLDEMEEERHRTSVSNHDDTPKPEESEELVAQEQVKEDDADIAKEESELPEPMDVDVGGANDGRRDTTSGADQLSNADHSDAEKEAEEEQKTEVVGEPANPEEEVEAEEVEDDEEHFQRERKRKGKGKVVPLPKKKMVSRPTSRSVIIQEPSQPVQEISVSDSDKSQDSDTSYYEEEGEREGDSETTFMDSEDEQELISYDGMDVEIEKEDV